MSERLDVDDVHLVCWMAVETGGWPAARRGTSSDPEAEPEFHVLSRVPDQDGHAGRSRVPLPGHGA